MIKYGFQTYTWQMSFEKYAGKTDHILGITKQGGLHAFESEIGMLGGFFDSPPEVLKKVLAETDVELAAVCLVCDWLGNGETEDEKRLADKAIKFVAQFPGTLFNLCQMPQTDRADLEQRQKNAITCLHDVAKRALDAGVVSAFHPNSPPGSVFRTYDDYKWMLDALDSRLVGFVPDSGHIIKGGMDVYDIFKDYVSVTKHVHFKDINAAGTWCVMGEGITDFVRIADILKSGGYDGYVLIEDESPEAEVDPDAVALRNAKYIHNKLLV